jgi:ribosomal RNA-processing protein 12
MRMPVEVLLPWLGPMQEGMLLWAEDSKNKFKLKVRTVLERLVRRCGVEAVAAATPEGDARLLIHIRKQQARKERRRSGSVGGSQVRSDERGDLGYSQWAVLL